MNEFKGTPGPWRADEKTIKQDYTPIGLSKESGCILGSMMGGSTSGPFFVEIDEEVLSNAKLAASSPELFKAVNDFLNHFQGNIPLWLFEEAESAVAKALGK